MEHRDREMGMTYLETEYARLRLMQPELGANQAARVVGFSSRRPSPGARMRWDRVVALRESPEIGDALEDSRERLEADERRAVARLTEIRIKMSAQDVWEKAKELLAETEKPVAG